ncbi:HlyD family secretion protein [Reyranella aquatilis]|uniref:HlyD family secretion protein n=1 Tax=Reyranella aquatilis TaxID=2035356 RepID=A0ABS8L3I4_9HYPH|nr:HlyD family secretion protein [Reyranella aquatilis]MCC8432907.1 HlyD family secretion protein [Reyranella aquatilis]
MPPPALKSSPVSPAIGVLPRERVSRTSGLVRVLLRPRFIAIGIVLLLAVAYGGRELHLRLTHVYEYDARVTADIVTVSSRAEGWIVDLAVREGQRVEAGQVLVRIDDRAAKLRVDGLKAQIEGVRVERARLRAERKLDQNQADAAMRTRTSSITVREKALAALRADLDFAKLELDRSRTLFASRVINERQLQVAQALVTKLEIQILQLQAEHEQAEGSLAEAKVGHDRLGVIDAQIEALTHQVAVLAAQMRQQQVDVEDRTIKSPIPAVIDRTFTLPGEYVAAGQRILLLHNPDEVWVEANIKETQVGKLKIGQPVRVSVDAYPDDTFIGRVGRIGSATTARFALLPTPNPSGNFTKITQRVPVKIDMVQMPKPLTPGMMVEVEIDIR